MRRLVCILLVCLAPCASAVARGDAPPEMSLLCGATPVEKGLHLDREGIAPESVVVDGETTVAWVSKQNSVAADAWGRSFCVTVTDPRFQNGQIPFVDIDVVYLHEGNTKVELRADTKDGDRVVASGWGNQRHWQTLHCRLENAFFGHRDHEGNPKELPLGKFDLRLNAWAGDFRLRGIVVHGFDPKHPADWSRFLSVEGASSPKHFIVPPGGDETVSFDVRNDAQVAADVVARFEILAPNGRAVKTATAPVTLAPGAVTPVAFKYDAAGLSWGEYPARLSLDYGPSSDRKTAAAYDQPVAVAGANDAFVVFDKEPIVRGMSFDRTSVQPVRVRVDGAVRWIWNATFGSQRNADAWWNSYVFTMTDPRFTKANAPVVDLRVTYLHQANAPVTLFADTAAGSRQIAGGWGRNESWQTIETGVDDAQFAQTDYHDNPKDLKTDGFDLRFNACTGPGQLRSIFVHAYDLDDNPDYKRLLRFDGIDAGRDLLIFEPGTKQDLSVKFTNLARPPLEADCRIRLADDMGNTVWERSRHASIPHGPADVPIEFSTEGLRQGVYTLQLSISRTVGGRPEELFRPSIDLMVSERSPIPKAKPGEFLYGIDTGVDYRDEAWMKWLDFLGVDVTRGNGSNADPDDWENAFKAFDAHHLQNSVFVDVPWDADPGVRAQKERQAAGRAEAAAEKYGDRAHYWELGNEPDLTFFYPGPIEAYVHGFEQISDAIKRGNPNACVMNGGLSFAGSEGDQRSRKFIELVPAGSIDAIAYHGHGPLVAAERTAHDRAVAEAARWGKSNKLFIETESGVAASTPGQIRVQARTAVEKLVYAQSVHMPVFMFFRLYITGGDAGYTMLKNAREPRPSVLSYRTMTRLLKGLQFVRVLDLGGGDEEAYLFADPNGPARALVYWSDRGGGAARAIQLASRPDAASAAHRVDLFGNAAPLGDTSDGIATVTVEPDPNYLLWKSTEAPDAVAAVPSPVRVDPVVFVTPGADDHIDLTVRNASGRAANYSLAVTAGAASGLSLPQPSMTLELAPRSEQVVSVPVKVAPDLNAVSWPRRWTVFAPVPADAVDPRNFADAVPTELTVKGQTIKPKIARLKDDHFDIEPIGGRSEERKQAIAFAVVHSPVDQTVEIGSSADWWEQWFVNGTAVYDDLDAGNAGPQSIVEHTFKARLKAGDNILAVRVLSGSQGWKLWCGGPQELAAARGGSDGQGNALAVELREGQSIVARERSIVARRNRIRPPSAPVDGPFAGWNSCEPDGELLEEGVVNEWAKQPDSRKWWRGEGDLSGRIWVRADAKRLYVIAAVRDDTFRPAPGDAIDRGDSLRVAVTAADGRVLQLGLPGQGTTVFRREGEAGSGWRPVPPDAASQVVERIDAADGGTTWYRLSLDASLIKAGAFAVNVQANDDDDFGEHKQSDAWFPGMDGPPTSSGSWFQAALPGR